MLKSLTLSLLLVLTLNTAAWADSTIVSLDRSYLRETPYQVESRTGVVETVYGKTMVYVYKCEDGTTEELPDNLSKQVQDNRPMIEKHPELSKFRAFCAFANPIIMFIGLVF